MGGKVSSRGRKPLRKPVGGPPAGRVHLDGLVRQQLALSWGDARALIARGHVLVDGSPMLVSTAWVAEDAKIEVDRSRRKVAPNERALPSEAIVHLDAHVVVVRKPAGLSTIPFEDEEEDNLARRVRDFLTKRDGRAGMAPLGVVHRLDKDTSGLMVFTRTWLAKKSLSQQFRFHTTDRAYLALVHGQPRDGAIRSVLVRNRGDGLRGSLRGGHVEGAKLAVTWVQTLESREGVSLIECKLETGRTHQIRIHLAEAGHPLVGERVYNRGFRGEPIEAARQMLHARLLGFVHPATEQRMEFEDAPPEDFCAMASKLGFAYFAGV